MRPRTSTTPSPRHAQVHAKVRGSPKGCIGARAHGFRELPDPPLPQHSAHSPSSVSQRICRRRHVAQLGLMTAGDAQHQLSGREGNDNGHVHPSTRSAWVRKSSLLPEGFTGRQSLPGKVLTSGMLLPCSEARAKARPVGREHSSAPLLPLSVPTSSLYSEK